jgi:hypothetical protein
MQKFLFVVIFASVSCFANAQCPNLLGAMVNSCGTNEGSNEFIVFETPAGVSAAVSNYRVLYGTGNPPTSNQLSGADATADKPIGNTSTITSNSCTQINVTDPNTVIPASSRVVFIPFNFDQNYNLTALCAGGTLYVVYVKPNAFGGTASNWTTSGTIANTPATSRFLQVTYSGNSSCNGTNAPTKAYTNGWATNNDGNFVAWNLANPIYTNDGCNSVVLSSKFTAFSVNQLSDALQLNWSCTFDADVIGFTIEESINAVDFKSIATTSSIINQQDYSLKIATPKVGRVWYRIKTNTISSKTDYAQIIAVNLKNNNTVMSLNQNPVLNNNVQLQIFAETKQTVRFNILNATGNVVSSLQKNLPIGSSVQNLQINKIASGIYVLQAIFNNGVKSIRFLVN